MIKLYIVRLTPKERSMLSSLVNTGRVAAYRLRQAQFLLLYLLFAIAGCGGDGSGDSVVEKPLDPNNPGTSFTAVTDPEQRDSLIQDMWQTLSTKPCWSGAFVTDPTIGGSVGSVAQFAFFGQFEYRFVGSSTFFGSVFLLDVGRFQGLPAAIIETWTGVREGIVILDSATFNHAFPNPANTALVVTTYRAVDDASRFL